MPYAAAIAGGAALLGGLMTNAASAREARRNRAFQERMSSTAHQREVEDLRKANINPMFRGMGGADTPSGGQAQFENPVPGAVSSAVQTQVAKAQLDEIQARTALTAEQALQLRSTRDFVVDNARYQLDILAATADTKETERARARAELSEMFPLLVDRVREELSVLRSTARAHNASAVLDEMARTGAYNIQKLEEALGSASPAVRMLLEVLRAVPNVSSRTINPTTIIKSIKP